jgi:glycosyltransferase involved in cell wall biosynthesis
MHDVLLSGFPKGVACHIIPPGVDVERFSPENGVKHISHIQSAYGVAHDKPIILYVGRLSCAKHIPMLMDAVCELECSGQLVLVGSGPEELRLQAYAKRIGLPDRVIFAGMQHEMLPGFYAMSRVTVLPTTIESFGQVYLESLACGTPVVGFAGDGRRVLTATQEIVRDGETGAIARTVSARALAEKIDSILSLDDDAYAIMSQRAQEDVRERFSWERFVKEALALSTQNTAADRQG